MERGVTDALYIILGASLFLRASKDSRQKIQKRALNYIITCKVLHYVNTGGKGNDIFSSNRANQEADLIGRPSCFLVAASDVNGSVVTA